MKIEDTLLKDIFQSHLRQALEKILPNAVKEAVNGNTLFVGQEFIPIRQAAARYSLSRRTLYNYHNKGYITLHTSEGKTFVSICELENHIKNNPLGKK